MERGKPVSRRAVYIDVGSGLFEWIDVEVDKTGTSRHDRAPLGDDRGAQLLHSPFSGEELQSRAHSIDVFGAPLPVSIEGANDCFTRRYQQVRRSELFEQ